MTTKVSFEAKDLRSCVGCGNQILDQYILRVAPNLEWHAACLRCCECQMFLDETHTCFVREGKTFCKEDYLRETLFFFLLAIAMLGAYQGQTGNNTKEREKIKGGCQIQRQQLMLWHELSVAEALEHYHNTLETSPRHQGWKR